MSVSIFEKEPLIGDRVARFNEGDGEEQKGKWHPSFVIIAVAFFNRAGMLGLVCNLVQYLQYEDFLKWHDTTGATLAAILCHEMARLGAVFSGLLADARLGHYNVLLVSLSLQWLGAVLLMAAAITESNVDRNGDYLITFRGLVTSGLIVFGLGIAGSSGTEIPLGVSQHALSNENPEQAKIFFPRYYWFVNLGATVGNTVIATVQVNWRVTGYILPAAFYLLSIIVLVVFRKTLLTERPSGANPISDIWRITKEAISLRWKQRRRGRVSNVDTSKHNKSWKAGSLAYWVRYAEESYGGSVDYNTAARAHNFLSVVAVISTLLFCQVTIAQTSTSFTSQGNLMSLPIPRTPANQNATHLPPSVFSAFNNIGVLVGIPLLHICVYPWWEKFIAATPPSHTVRIQIGILFAILAVGSAAVVEAERSKDGRWNFLNATDRTNHNITLAVSSLSIFWQIPQYFLSGVSEVFIVVSALEFAYAYSPTGIKGISVGLVYASIGLSSMISVGAVAIIQEYGPSFFFTNDDQGKVFYFFVVLGSVMLVGLVVFHFVAKSFRPVAIHGTTAPRKTYGAAYTTAVHSPDV